MKVMYQTLKKINKIMRVFFIGFIAIYGIVKIFDIVPKNRKEKPVADSDPATSEFDELW